MKNAKAIRDAFEKGKGILRLAPNFVLRRFSQAGRRLRLHPDDYYALGTARGSIKERWFSSVIPAKNGPLAPADEGMSYVAPTERKKDMFLFKDAVDELGAEIIGEALTKTYGTWPMYSKFFDCELPLFHHLHLDDTAAGRVGRMGKPEAYYFPPQLNNHLGTFPVTYFGFDPDATKELGTGWYTPPGVVHAPGSVLTYEPQWNSDVNSVQENITSGEVHPRDFLVENVPENKKRDIDYIMSLMDWEKNGDPHYRKRYFRPPVPCPQTQDGLSALWVVYANPYIGAKETTVLPGRTVTLKEAAAFGCIIVQGFGRIGIFDAEAAGMLRFGQLSGDEYFVSEKAAREGVTITNASRWEPMAILQHFGPDNREMPKELPA